MTKVDERTAVPGVDRAARERLARALDREPVAAAYLFGSQASGEAGSLSDVDVAVALLPGADRAAAQADLLIAAIEALGTEEIDLIVLDGASPLLRHRVLRDGIRLVDRDARARVALRDRRPARLPRHHAAARDACRRTAPASGGGPLWSTVTGSAPASTDSSD